MAYNPYSSNFIKLYCPVCSTYLGGKIKGELASFICQEDGCSQTKHYFYPGEIKRPGKSVPWHSYYEKRNKCGRPCCDPTPDEDLD